MAHGGTSGIEEDAAHARPAVTGGLAVAGLAAALGVRRQADQGGDLLGREQAELGQIGDQRDRRHRADAEDGLQQPGQFGGWG